MLQRTLNILVTGAVIGASLGFGCRFDDTDHCALEDGDDYCGQKYGGEARRYCARGNAACQDRFPAEDHDGCVDARPDDAACYSPCGDGKSAIDDPECEGVADGSSSSVSASATEATTEPTGGPTTAGSGSMSNSGSETESASSGTTAGGCTLSVECADPASPICADMACVPCSSDDECLAKSADAPACSDTGRCVACTPSNASACTDTTPICNAAINECEGCDFHEQCPDSACRIATGACFDTAEVYDVGAGQTYANIEAAVTDLGEGGEVVLRIHDGPSYDGAVTIAGAGTAYAFLADDDAMVPQWINSMDASPTLLVEDGAEVYVQSLRFTANTDGAYPGITADGATLYLDRTSVVGNDGGGLLFSNDAHGYLRTCIVGGNGAGLGPSRGLTVDASTLEVAYSTIARNDADTADDSLSCLGASTVSVRNSILVGRDDPSVLCAGATIQDSALDQGFGGNTNVGPFVAGWFDNAAGNVFTLSAMGGAVFGDVAQWVVGDPAVDIDGDPRPTEPGPDVAGADIP